MGLLQNESMRSFLINMAASGVWDGVKKMRSHATMKNPKVVQIAEIIEATMQQFYDEQGYSYSDAVMTSFFEQISEYDGVVNRGTLRHIVDGTIYPRLTDDDYRKWIDILIRNCTESPDVYRWFVLQETKEKIFSDRNLILQRMEAKLNRYVKCTEEHDVGSPDERLNGIFLNLDVKFSFSWKDDLLQLLGKLSVDENSRRLIDDGLTFIRSNEDCCEILIQAEKVIHFYALKNSDRDVKRKLFEFIKHPSFNKVLIITGTTGAGKTFFVKEYVKHGLRMLRAGTAEIVPCVIASDRFRDIYCFEQTVLQELGKLIGEDIPSLAAARQMLDALAIKICFVIDNVHAIVDQVSEWRSIVAGVKRFSQYEVFTWILTINEYEYYLLEDDQDFMEFYCIKKESIIADDSRKTMIFDHALSLNEMNRDWAVVKHILEDQFHIAFPEINEDIYQGISTPLEAICFGECVYKEEYITFPSTYYDYVKKIVTWKSEALAKHGSATIQHTILKIVDSVIATRTSLIQNIQAVESDLNVLRHVQLLSKIESKNTDIFSVFQSFSDISYQIRVFPYWAAKIVGERFQSKTFDAAELLTYQQELKEWIIPCYIFIHFEDDNEWSDLFSTLKNGRLMEYALFCAKRSSPKFCHALYEFLLQNIDYISDNRSCYAVFVNGKLK